MPDFHDTRQALSQARRDKESLRQNLFLVREKAKRIAGRLQRLERAFDPNNKALVRQKRELEAALASAQNDENKLASAYTQLLSTESQLFAAFAPFSDPRQQVEELTDSLPVLLMPLRLETRFKDVPLKDGTTRPYLWVRVFPDDWAVDNFDPALSENEITNAQVYWAAYWKAGGFEEQERTAWRGLVASHGTGRSGWIISQYRPVNEGEKPSKANVQDVILVIRTDTPLTIASERDAASAFWEAVWKAGTNQADIDQAYQDLVNAVDPGMAATIRNEYVPVNLADEPPAPFTREQVNVKAVWITVPSPDDWEAKTRSWSQQARTHVLPDRFVLRLVQGETVREVLGAQIPSPLALGPDPSAEPSEQLNKDDGKLKVPEELKWMVDFDEAVGKGMGFKVPLSAEERKGGFDRLMVLGVRLSNDETESQELLETLIDHHHYSLNEFSLLPQGTPTNNTEDQDSGYTYQDDAERSFDRYVNTEPQFTLSEDWLEKRDGQWLAELLGIRPEVLENVAFSGGKDQAESRAMNTVLWPATLEYTMEAMMGNVFGPTLRRLTREFFTHMVVPRGLLPAIRIGKQPYGILPATAWSRMQWITARSGPVSTHVPGAVSQAGAYLSALYGLLKKIDSDWDTLQQQVSHVGKSGDAHQILLDILGLHPSSVEYYQRYAQSVEQFINQFNLMGVGGKFFAWLIAGAYVKSGQDLLTQLGASLEEAPEILQKLFLQSENLLQGPLIDDQPLSETALIRHYTPDNRNYIQWLIDAAGTSLETLRLQSGFTDNKRPRALLYQMLRHALQLGYWDASLELLRSGANPVLSEEQVRIARLEPKFIHLQGQVEQSESKFHYLYQAAPSLTGSPTLTVGEFIPSVLRTALGTRYLSRQLDALEVLKDSPTSRLERVFAEHIDACTYRLDAWQQALVNYQLLGMRGLQTNMTPQVSPNGVQQGIHLGAYGYLEEVRPENKVLKSVRLSPELDALFNTPGEPPLVSDEQNQGFIHAPSLNHAVTAAVLRNGYLSNATPSNPDSLSVNLSSERVRLAMGILDGMRNGQRLGALLGYQLERDLHDNHQLAETDAFIFDLRKAFPLVANRMKSTQLEEPELDSTSIEAIEARNVVDGLKLAEHIQKTGNGTYPFGKSKLPAATPAQAAKINAAVDRMLNIKDAVADLVIAESVHQAVLGNYDRAAGNLDSVSRGGLPPIPDVVQTPRSGVTLTHRFVLALDAHAGSKGSPWMGIPLSPRALAEPSLNLWLASLLPEPEHIVVRVHRDDTDATSSISVRDLGLQPIDLLFILRMEGEQAMQDLDDRILQRALATAGAFRANTEWTIRYTELVSDPEITLFQLAPLMESLRKLTLSSRALKASDMALHNEASEGQDASATINLALVTNARDTLNAQLPGLDGYIATLGALLDDPEANQAALVSGVDTHLADFLSLAEAARSYGIPEAGSGFGYDWKKQFFRDLDARIHTRADAWTQRAGDFDTLMAGYAALTTDEERFELLQKAERLIRTTVTTPLPLSPATLHADLLAHKVQFDNKFAGLFGLLSAFSTSVSGYMAALGSVLPLDEFDWEEFSVEGETQRIITFSEELLTRAQTLRQVLASRVDAADAQVAAYGATASQAEKVAALQAAGKALFGEDFQLIPHFSLEESQGIELENAYNHRSELLEYQHTTLGVDFPVDEWFYGMARVRQKLHHWERATLISEGFTGDELLLDAMQLPFTQNDSWLALEFPETYEIDSDRLLLTMHHAVAFYKSQPQCGLILDEWTEVIPTREETTGVTFHYDKPNSEPPQVMLLATPTRFTGGWEWDDLVGAVEESFARAKKRAVEPEQIDGTAYARFLPATISAVTLHPITIAMNLAVTNGINEILNNP